jgi:hypothetical protein
VVGTFANWGTTTAIALLGTSRATPIAGAGHAAGEVAETAVLGMLVLVSLAMIGAVGTIAFRLWRRDSPDACMGSSTTHPGRGRDPS